MIGTVAVRPELRATQSGKYRTELLLAVSRGFKREDGTDWIRVMAWEKTAELCAQYLDKGSKVQVQGRLRGDWYESKETGKKRLGMEIVANKVEFLSRPPRRGPEQDDPEPEPQRPTGGRSR